MTEQETFEVLKRCPYAEVNTAYFMLRTGAELFPYQGWTYDEFLFEHQKRNGRGRNV